MLWAREKNLLSEAGGPRTKMGTKHEVHVHLVWAT
jgi:hypothetical protein